MTDYPELLPRTRRAAHALAPGLLAQRAGQQTHLCGLPLVELQSTASTTCWASGASVAAGPKGRQPRYAGQRRPSGVHLARQLNHFAAVRAVWHQVPQGCPGRSRRFASAPARTLACPHGCVRAVHARPARARGTDAKAGWRSPTVVCLHGARRDARERMRGMASSCWTTCWASTTLP